MWKAKKNIIYLFNINALVLYLFVSWTSFDERLPVNLYHHAEVMTTPQDSFRLQLFHESSGAKLPKVNVFNNCDFSSTQSQNNGTINIALKVGECCEFTFSKDNFATKDMTLCAVATQQGVELKEETDHKKNLDFVPKGGDLHLKKHDVFKDIDTDVYLSSYDNQPFTGNYKGQIYENGKIKTTNFCCQYPAEESEFLDRSLSLVKKGIETNQVLKIGLQSVISLQVKGLVLEEKHEFPIEEAKVILVNENNRQDCQIKLTNLDGIFDFALRKNECYQLWVEKENFTQVGKPIQICTHHQQDTQVFEFNIFLK